MTLLKESRSRHPVTRSYDDLRPVENTKLYDYQPEDKALAMALAAYSATSVSRSRATASRPETTYKSEFDEDTLIISESATVRSPKREKPSRRRTKPNPLSRYLFGRVQAFKRFPNRKTGGRRTPIQPKAPAIIQFYNGVVESVHEGLAYLTLEARSGQRLQIEWDEVELAGKGIKERQPFILKTITEENKLEYEFIPDQLHPLSNDLQREISDLMSHYRATGELDDDDA
jgi:hypothetical protein